MLKRAVAVIGAGTLAGSIALVATPIAGAQGGGTATETPPAAADENAIWERYDQCLVDNGVNFDELEAGDVTPETEAALDAAFETCDPILDELPDNVMVDAIDPEIEAIFERHDQCLTDNGVNLDQLEDGDITPETEATLDAAFEACDPILDELPEDVFFAGCDELEEGDHEDDGEGADSDDA